MIHVPTLDAADITAALSGRCIAGVVVAASHHLCDVAVAAAGAACQPRLTPTTGPPVTSIRTVNINLNLNISVELNFCF